MNKGEMKNKKLQQVWIAIGTVVICQLTEAQSVAAAGSSGVANEFGGHPMLSVFVHIVFLSVLLGVGSTIVAVLFKPPFRE